MKSDTSGIKAFISADGEMAFKSAVTGDASNITFKADTITLGDATGGALGLKKSEAAKFNFLAADGKTAADYELKDVAGYIKTQEVANTYRDGNHKVLAAAKGEDITTNLKITNDGKLSVLGGEYNATGNIELDKGSIAVGGGAKGVNASLTLTGNLVLNNNQNNANTISVTGGDKSQMGPSTQTDLTGNKNTRVTLDLTRANLTQKFADSDGTGLTTISATGEGATLLMTAAQVGTVLDLKDKVNSTSDSGAGVLLGAGAQMIVDGDLGELKVSHFKNATANTATTETITFSGGGELIASSASIDAGDNADALDLGKGELVFTDGLTFFTNKRVDVPDTNPAQKAPADITLKSGTIRVGNTLDTVGSKIVLGSGGSGANIALGYADLETDQYGYLTDAGAQGVFATTSTAADNLVNGDIELNGADASNKSALTVDYGKWTLQNITATSGDITVGMSELDGVQAANLQYGAGAPSLKAKKVELKGSSKLTVNEQASAELKQLVISDNASTVTLNNSTLTVAGEKTVNDKAQDQTKNVSYGFITSGAGSEKITVKGSKAVLTIGSTALEAINKIEKGSGNEFEITYDADLENDKPFGAAIKLEQMGTLKLDFAEGTTFSADQIHALRKTFLSNNTYGQVNNGGFIDLGNAKISGLSIDTETNTVSYNDLKAFTDVNAVFDVVNEDLKSAQVVNIGQTDTLSANVGNVKLNDYDSTLKVGKTNLFTADKNGLFVSNVATPTKAGNASVVAGGSLGLYNGGTIGKVTLAAGGTLSETSLLVSSEKGETKIAQIKGATGTVVTIDGATVVEKGIDSVTDLVVNQDLKVLSGGITASVLSSSEGAKAGKITADSLSVGSDVDAVFTKYNGDFDISGVAEFKTYAELGGQNMKFGTLKFGINEGDDLKLTAGNTSAGVLELVSSSNSDNDVYVGTESTVGADGKVDSGSSATLYAARAQLNGNAVYADPAFGLPSSLVMFKQVGKETDLTEAKIKANGNKAGVLDGSLNALRNSVIAVGIDGKDTAEAQAKVRTDLANLFDANGSLRDPSVKGNEDSIASVVYVADALNVASGQGIIVYNDTYSSVDNKYSNNIDNFNTNVNTNDVYLGANTALAISDVATAAVKTTTTAGQNGGAAVETTTGRAAIHFEKSAASMYAEKDAKILLTGDGLKAGSTISLFSDNDATGSEGIKLTLAAGVDALTVQTVNGLLKYEMKAGDNVGQGVTLALDYNVVNNSYNDASAPVKHAIVSYLAGDMNWDDTTAGAAKEQLLGNNVSAAVKYDGTKFSWTDAAAAATINQNDYVAVEVKDEAGKVTYQVYEQAYNALLDNANKTTSGRDAESVARMGMFGGAAQAALTANSASSDAVSGRFGMGQNSSALTYADNGQGAGMWVTPIYRSADADGFEADNVSYGSDVKLFGAALGGDFTMANGLRVGGMLNFGSGDADGQGIGSAVSNDFSYFGGSLYAGFAINNISIVGDIGYSVVDSDVEANTAIGKASTSFDTTALTVGVTGQYAMDFSGVDVVPHAGMRFTRIDMDNYDVKTADADLAHYNASTSNVFSIPVGVTVAKEYVMDTWTVKPSFDLTLTGNFGDDTLDGNVEWAGISNMTTDVKSEFVDSFTYGTAIGVAAQSGNLGFGVGLNYTGSSNVKEFGANANVRYVF